MIVECKTCGHKFDNNGDSKRKYCSNFCAHDGKKYKCAVQSSAKRDSNNHLRCTVCGGEMTPGRRGKDKKYCSDKCKRDSRKAYMASYYKDRYENDPSFRNCRHEYDSKYGVMFASERRIRDLRALSLMLENKSSGEIFELLDKNIGRLTMKLDSHRQQNEQEKI